MASPSTPSSPPTPKSLELLKSVCDEQDYTFEWLDSYSRQLVRVSNGKDFFLSGVGRLQCYPLNDAAATAVVRDKVFTYQTLQAANIKVPAFEYVFLRPEYRAARGEGRERSDLNARADRLGFPLFVKPLDGSRGALTEIVSNCAELEAHIDRIAERFHGALLQPVLEGREWRVFMIDDALMFAYQRARPVLRGDGEHSISELLDVINQHHTDHGVSWVNIRSGFLQEQLRSKGLQLDTIMRQGDELVYSARANISAGGQITGYTEEIPNYMLNWARDVMKTLRIRVGAIDFFARDTVKGHDGLDLVEVNSNPSLTGLLTTGREDKAREIWARVCERFFVEADAQSARNADS